MRIELAVAKQILAGLSDAAVLVDLELKAVACNAGYAELAGLRPRTADRELARAADIFTVLGSDPAEDRRHALNAIEKRRVIRVAEAQIRNAAGDVFTALVSFGPLLAETGEPAGLVLCYRNMSDEARVHANYKEMLAAERDRAAQLELAVEARTSELRNALEEVTRLSRTDVLTGLLNRRSFTEHAEQAIGLAQRNKATVGIILCDLDHFKSVNDTYGHQAGDAILKASSAALRGSVRNTDKVARFGGEEFIILLPETDPSLIEVVGQRCREAVRAISTPELVPGMKGPQTVSIGIARYPIDGDNLDTLVARADHALYHSKRTGRDRVTTFSPDLPAEEKVKKTSRRSKVLILDPDASRVESYTKPIADRYDVVVASTIDEFRTELGRGGFEAFVVENALGGELDGVDCLRESLRQQPESLRVLLLQDADLFAEVRGANLARVDCFLLRRDATSHLRPAIDDALVRRELRATMLTHAPTLNAYTAQIRRLEEIITTGNLNFAYQPIIDARTGAVRAYEALCRVKDSVFSNPEILFDAALRSGNIWDLGRRVREVATRPLPQLPEGVLLFVNMHPAEVDDPEVCEAKIPCEMPKQVVFEITERASIPDYQRLRRTMGALNERGFRFAIDDLGAGYASLNSIAMLGAQFMKIDMALVRGIHGDPKRKNLVRRMVQFAEDEGIEVIAEGIEEHAEAEVLREVGCHLLQGYLFGRPLPLPESAKLRVG